MLSPVILLVLLAVFFFSFYGKKTFIGFWGSFFLLLFFSVLLFPVMGPFSFLPGVVVILLMGNMNK
jgi:hypothetical protein